MTVSELEQAMRNLISTQPMITVGPNGDVVSSLLAIIDNYKNFSFKVQVYPAQDAFKFGMMSELQKLENDMCNYICQTMSSRGINLLLYTPQAQYNSSGNAFNSAVGVMNQNMAMGQMMYQPQTPNIQFAQTQPQPTYQSPINMPNISPQFATGAPMGQMVQGSNIENHPYQQSVVGGGVINQKQAQSKATVNQRRPVSQSQGVARPAPQPQATQTAPQPQTSVTNSASGANVQKPATASNAKASKPSPAEVLMGSDAPSGKAQGRDYLLELLKK